MKIFDKIERKYGHLGIHNLTKYLIFGQAALFFLGQISPNIFKLLNLSGNLVLSGEYWRLLAFLFVPMQAGYFFTALLWYFYYMCGTALESSWGAFRYTFFVFISYIATIGAAFLFPDLVLTNSYLYMSIFLAFAQLYPEFQIMLFFIIPVKVKWLALLSWIGIIGSILLGNNASRILSIISILNLLAFFGKDLFLTSSLHAKNFSAKTAKKLKLEKANHVCKFCKTDEVKNPDMEIFYCAKCDPETCYCGDHVDDHVHLKKK